MAKKIHILIIIFFLIFAKISNFFFYWLINTVWEEFCRECSIDPRELCITGIPYCQSNEESWKLKNAGFMMNSFEEFPAINTNSIYLIGFPTENRSTIYINILLLGPGKDGLSG